MLVSRLTIPTLLLLLGTSLTHCATYSLPSGRLESPEVTGPGRVGRLEALGVQGGADLTSSAVTVVTDSTTGATEPRLKSAFPNVFVGFVASLGEKWDAGIRISPGAPVQLRAKYQLSGENEAKAAQGNFAVSLTGAVGLLMTGGSPGTTFFTFDVGLPLGYRLWERHLFSLSPFVTVGSLSGASSVSATQFGAALGYQYTFQTIILRAELGYSLGSSGNNKINQMLPAVLAGLSL